MDTAHHRIALRPLAPAEIERGIELLGRSSARDTSHRFRERLSSASSDELRVALVAEREGVIVGIAKATEEPTVDGTASVSVVVTPEAEGFGLGVVLAAALHEQIAESPLTFTTELRDDLPTGRRFAERYGFTVVHHSLGWRLELSGLADELRTRVEAASAALGIMVRQGDLVTDRVEVLDCVVRSARGLPGPTGVFEDFDPQPVLGYFSPDSVVLFAEHDGRAVGMGVMHRVPDTDEWYTDFTGVDVEYRGRGIAGLLKLTELEAAARLGATAMETHTDESNVGIVAVNRTAGMHPIVGYWSMVRTSARRGDLSSARRQPLSTAQPSEN